MAVEFSSSDSAVLSRQVDAPYRHGREGGKRKSEKDLRDYYEIEKCVQFLHSNPRMQKVALQFPDFLLPDAAMVTRLLGREVGGREPCVLGDTSYGSCCVDEVAAEHAQADCIIHFGPACLTQTKRLPVLYVFGHEQIDRDECVAAFRDLLPETDAHILVLYDTVYAHCIEEMEREVVSHYPNCVFSKLVPPSPITHQPPEVALTHLCTCSGPHTCAERKGKREQDRRGGEEGERRREVEEGRLGGREGDEGKRGVTAAGDDTKARDQVGSQGYLEAQDLTGAEVSADLGDKHVSPGSSESDKLCGDQPQTQLHSYRRFGRSFELSRYIEDYTVFYIGIEGATLTNFMLNYSKWAVCMELYRTTYGCSLQLLSQFYSYNPLTRVSRRETLIVNKALARRYYLVQKAKEAQVCGILVGTLGAADYLEIIERLKAVMKQAGKKYYTIAVGKLNVCKLANLLEVDVYVLVACPENTLIDSHEFYKPVVTPYEMDVACLRAREWTGEYITDYQGLLPGASHHVPIEESQFDTSPEYSLITGGLVPSQNLSEEKGTSERSAVVPRKKMDVAIPSAGAEFLHSRQWRGLEQRLGEGQVGGAVEGTSGIAVSYTHEHQSTTAS